MMAAVGPYALPFDRAAIHESPSDPVGPSYAARSPRCYATACAKRRSAAARTDPEEHHISQMMILGL
jgi:hypothetical protein